MRMQNWVQETKAVSSRFNHPEWSVEARTLDLMEEVGELCNAILVEEGHKHIKRKKSDIADSICDILFDLFLLADKYHIQLDVAYQEMLTQLRARQDNHEFE